MAKCKKCGKQQFLRKGLCYKCFQEESRLSKHTAERPDVYKICNKCGKEGSFRNDLCPECWQEKYIQEGSEEANKFNQEIADDHKIRNVNYKILILEDEPSVYRAYIMILKIKDYNYIKWATNSDDAISLLEKEQFDLFITDRNHPGLKGEELLELIKGKYPNMQRIVITAYGSVDSNKRSIEAGAMEYLRKPFLMEEIYELIERAQKRSGIKK